MSLHPLHNIEYGCLTVKSYSYKVGLHNIDCSLCFFHKFGSMGILKASIPRCTESRYGMFDFGLCR